MKTKRHLLNRLYNSITSLAILCFLEWTTMEQWYNSVIKIVNRKNPKKWLSIFFLKFLEILYQSYYVKMFNIASTVCITSLLAGYFECKRYIDWVCSQGLKFYWINNIIGSFINNKGTRNKIFTLYLQYRVLSGIIETRRK